MEHYVGGRLTPGHLKESATATMASNGGQVASVNALIVRL
jgi:hypothetical protein